MKKFHFLLLFSIITVTLFSCVNATKESSTLKEAGITGMQGDAQAQYLLGRQYYWGQGVAQNSREAMKWFQISAEQGNADAQYMLGSMYYLGDGVSRDYVLAYMWFTMADEHGNEKARDIRNAMEGKMTADQIEEALESAKQENTVHD